ncbi:MAG: ABC transporter permease [Planctomycetota bacterium]|nr:ABC transporter permease [Planctomycetota bacterium]
MNALRMRWVLPPVLLALALLYAPLLTIAVQSVNAARYGTSWQGFTWAWYAKLFQNETIGAAARNTLLLACVSTAVSTVLGTLLALGLDRMPWPPALRRGLDVLLHLPVITPDILFAAALVVAFACLRSASSVFDPGMVPMILGHITFQVAFVALVVRARLSTLEKDLYEAARDLYAERGFVFRHLTLPLLMPAVVAGALLAFTLSLDDFIISFFTTGAHSDTLPIFIYGSLRRGISPEIHALSTLMVLVTVGLVVGVERLTRAKEA